jgi:hypothetical protein
MHDPWTRDSVDVAATRFSRDGMDRVVRWDAFSAQLSRRRVNIWSYLSGRAPPTLGRWID